ncbi:hypothetical protein [Ancylobacter mangrovi]|uniref:hypothetical protein n=1 Tax=Ancylobacter mangrovi TaxID=2972472 RepID=UPI0021638866|nr:hypothetical protein [Ancylobacter mangrovi]MCS0501390.1 hypothetical protein [Ancylobacter mangrovi]
MTEAPAIISKGEFAALTKVSAGRVSQWIAEGKLSGAALVGEGRTARIHVPTAIEQLKLKLDIGQRFGNGLGTRLDVPSAAPPSPAPAVAVPPAPADPIEERIKREKLREIEFRNRDAAERELARRGTYMLAREGREQMTAVAAAMLNVFEGALPDFAAAIASRFEVPQRDVLHLLRGELRGIRERASKAARQKMESLPADIIDEVAPAGSGGDEPGQGAG